MHNHMTRFSSIPKRFLYKQPWHGLAIVDFSMGLLTDKSHSQLPDLSELPEVLLTRPQSASAIPWWDPSGHKSCHQVLDLQLEYSSPISLMHLAPRWNVYGNFSHRLLASSSKCKYKRMLDLQSTLSDSALLSRLTPSAMPVIHFAACKSRKTDRRWLSEIRSRHFARFSMDPTNKFCLVYFAWISTIIISFKPLFSSLNK